MQPRPFSSRRGFSLVEIMVVVLIVSVLGMVAVPSVARVKAKAKISAIVNDLRVFTAAFEGYSHETGKWPAEAAAGAVPAGMAGRIDEGAWKRKTPMGGQYNWENNQLHFGTRYRASIVISGTAASPLPLDVNTLVQLDRTLDDGNLLTGNFRVGTGIVPLLVLQR